MKKNNLFLIGVACTLVVFVAGCSSTAQNNTAGYAKIGNPAAVYCKAMGGTYQTIGNDMGEENGACLLPNNSTCDAWDFLSGQCGSEFSYCAKNGLETLTVTDGRDAYSSEYAVCVNADGRSVGTVEELSKLEEQLTSCTADETGPDLTSVAAADTESSLDLVPMALPVAFDWRNNNGNWLTPIRDQGGCGSCWAFSAVGAAEAAMEIAANDPELNPNLSEQYLVADCNTVGEYQNCCGGYTNQALTFIRDQGIPDESCMAYVDGTGCSCDGGTCDENCTYRTGGSCSDRTCSNRCSDWSSRLTRLKTVGSVGTDHTTIKTALIEKGPLTASLYMGGTFNGDVYKCSTTNLPNHAVVIVGYNDAGQYWIVRNSWGATWNGDGYFKVGYDQCHIDNYVGYATTDIPETFTKTSPSNGSTNIPDPVTLSWKASPAASSYEVCVDTSNDNACSTGWVSTGIATTYSFTQGALLEGIPYFWQVRAVNSYGSYLADHDTWWTFSLSEFQFLPENDSKLTTSKVTFDWDDINGATAYKLQLSPKPDFSTLLVNIKTSTSTYAYLTPLARNTNFYWRIRVLSGGVWSSWYPAWHFVSMDPLLAPTLISPEHRITLTTSPVTLEWSAVTNAAQYKVEIATDATFTTKVASRRVMETKTDFTLSNGRYFWRVRPIDASGGKGPWSLARIFKVNLIP